MLRDSRLIRATDEEDEGGRAREGMGRTAQVARAALERPSRRRGGDRGCCGGGGRKRRRVGQTARDAGPAAHTAEASKPGARCFHLTPGSFSSPRAREAQLE